MPAPKRFTPKWPRSYPAIYCQNSCAMCRELRQNRFNPEILLEGAMIAQDFEFTGDFPIARNTQVVCRLRKISCGFKRRARAPRLMGFSGSKLLNLKKTAVGVTAQKLLESKIQCYKQRFCIASSACKIIAIVQIAHCRIDSKFWRYLTQAS
jgi:hypothetical protein